MMDVGRLREKIMGFSFENCPLGGQGYNRVLLQILGYTAHGKSSFINSCKYALSDGEEFREHAETNAGDCNRTMVRNAFPLTESITMVDNRGCSDMNDFQKAEVYAQLGNFIRIGQRVNWRDDYTQMMEEIEDSDPNHTDFIVPIFIFSVKHVIPDPEAQIISQFMENCTKMTGIVPIVVLTNKTSKDSSETEKRFRLMGAETVIAIENYTRDSHIKTLGKTAEILKVIDVALNNVLFCLNQPRDPQRERIQRKKFLLRYIHRADISKREEGRRRQNEENPRERRNREGCKLL